jgi:hypothetical protein
MGEGLLVPRAKIGECRKNLKMRLWVFDSAEPSTEVPIDAALIDSQSIAAEPGKHDGEGAIKKGKGLLVINARMRDVTAWVRMGLTNIDESRTGNDAYGFSVRLYGSVDGAVSGARVGNDEGCNYGR